MIFPDLLLTSSEPISPTIAEPPSGIVYPVVPNANWGAWGGLDFIASNGAKVVIAGGMGAGAVNGCNARGMQVITGVTGSPDEAALLFAKGELVSSGSVCSHHGDHHHGEGHDCSHHGSCGH